MEAGCGNAYNPNLDTLCFTCVCTFAVVKMPHIVDENMSLPHGMTAPLLSFHALYLPGLLQGHPGHFCSTGSQSV